ncbi:hypothetical protein [Halorussus ruber]|uniref:hypothetical protein n=1 Tax=Halorussus ruber TaxID=1126238 RepID=UPI001092D571|nr:hypothetical protein [Halorussus ruber]
MGSGAGVSVFKILPLLFTVLSGIGVMLARHLEHPKDEYKQEVKTLQGDRWNDACGELGPVVADAYQFVTQNGNNHSPTELSDGSKAAMILRKVLDDRDDLGDLEDKLEALDKPVRAYKDCRNNRERAFWLAVISFAGFGLATLVVWLVPESMTTTIGEVVLFTLSFVSSGSGIYTGYQSTSARSELDEMVEDKDFM